MAKFKVRRPLLVKSGINVGVGGTLIKEILAGSVQFDIGAITASGDSACAAGTVSGLDAGAQVFLLAKDSLSGIIPYSACCDTANTINACFVSATGSGTATASVVFQYLAIAEG